MDRCRRRSIGRWWLIGRGLLLLLLLLLLWLLLRLLLLKLYLLRRKCFWRVARVAVSGAMGADAARGVVMLWFFTLVEGMQMS
jgi:hypothetical protein